MLSLNQEMFLRADMSKIAIGGGYKFTKKIELIRFNQMFLFSKICRSYDGLAINANLTEGSTNRCDTFENQPLANPSKFDIAILEVISFENN